VPKRQGSGHCRIERSDHSSWSHLPAQKPAARLGCPVSHSSPRPFGSMQQTHWNCPPRIAGSDTDRQPSPSHGGADRVRGALQRPSPAPRAGPSSTTEVTTTTCGVSLSETGDYITHHLKMAGRVDTLFSADAVNLIHNASRGYPRAVNTVCHHRHAADLFRETAPLRRPACLSSVTTRRGVNRRRVVWMRPAVRSRPQGEPASERPPVPGDSSRAAESAAGHCLLACPDRFLMSPSQALALLAT
jgi:hypothetical protein